MTMPQTKLRTEQARAWRKYLRETKELRGEKYQDTEPWLWAQLQTTLDRLQPPRSRAKEPA